MVLETGDLRRHNTVPPVDRSLGGAAAPEAPVQTATPAQTGASVANGGANASQGTATTAKPDGAKAGTAEGGETPKRMSLVEMYEKLNPSPFLTPEEEAKERKREKRQKMWAAIGDGISALSNLYFTTKGAPNMYDGKNSQSASVKSYWDKVREDRTANMRRYVDGYLRASQADGLEAIRKQNADAAQAAKEAEAKRKEAETIRKDELARAQREVLIARAAKDDAATEMAEKTMEYMTNYGWPLKKAKAEAELVLTKARTGQAQAQTVKATAQAKKTASGGSSGGGKPYGTFNGVTYKTKADYDKAVVGYAKANKIPLTYNKPSTDAYGMKRTTQTNRTIPGLATAGEAHYRATHAKPKPAAKPAATKKQYTHTKGLGL